MSIRYTQLQCNSSTFPEFFSQDFSDALDITSTQVLDSEASSRSVPDARAARIPHQRSDAQKAAIVPISKREHVLQALTVVRERKAMSVRELAEKAHLSVKTIYLAEQGIHIGRPAKRKIIYALRLELHDAPWLFAPEDPFA